MLLLLLLLRIWRPRLSLLLLLLWVLRALGRWLARLLLVWWWLSGALLLGLWWGSGSLALRRGPSDLLLLLLLDRRPGARWGTSLGLLLLLLLGHRSQLGLQLVDLLRQIELLLLAGGQNLQQSLELGLGLLEFVANPFQFASQLGSLLLETLDLLLQFSDQLLLLRLALTTGLTTRLLLLLLLLDLLGQIG